MITDQQKERIRELIQEGVPVNAISRQVGISRPSIYKILDSNGGPEGERVNDQVPIQSGNKIGTQVRHRHRFHRRSLAKSERLIKANEETGILAEKVEQERLKREFKNLTEGEARERMNEEKEKRHDKWKEEWIRFGLGVFWLDLSEIPPETKLLIKKFILKLIDGLDEKDNEEIQLTIQKRMNPLRELFCREIIYPKLKLELIWQAMQSLKNPRWMVDEKVERIKTEVRSSLENVVVGDEEIEEICDLAQCLADELVDEI